MTTGMDNVKNVQYVRQKCYNIQKALQAHNCGVHAVLYESRLRSSTGTKFEKWQFLRMLSGNTINPFTADPVNT